MKVQTILVILALFFGACAGSEGDSGSATSNSSTKKGDLSEKIEALEAKLFGEGKNANFNKVNAQETIAAYQEFAAAKPEDPKTPEYMFKCAEIYRSLRDFKKATDTYQLIYSKHNSYEKAPHSLFLMGFSYENDLKDMDKAKTYYEEFLAKYPDHELADDVQFSLKNLGRTPEEIIKEFEEKNKK